jgi:hypothetical protein
MPLYKLLKKLDTFILKEEAQPELDSLKAFLTLALVLVAPERREPLLHLVSTALVIKREEPCHALKVQRPVYFVSEVLTKTKAHYTQVHKLLYAMLMATKKLQQYFTNHEVTVVTSFPLVEVVYIRDATRRISKWRRRFSQLTELRHEGLLDLPRCLSPSTTNFTNATRPG